MWTVAAPSAAGPVDPDRGCVNLDWPHCPVRATDRVRCARPCAAGPLGPSVSLLDVDPKARGLQRWCGARSSVRLTQEHCRCVTPKSDLPAQPRSLSLRARSSSQAVRFDQLWAPGEHRLQLAVGPKLDERRLAVVVVLLHHPDGVAREPTAGRDDEDAKDWWLPQ